MNAIDTTELTALSIKRKQAENGELLFEKMWHHSISGDEFVKKTHEHLKNLYAARDKQNDSKVL